VSANATAPSPHVSKDVRPLWLLQTVVLLVRGAEDPSGLTQPPPPETVRERQLLAYLSAAVSATAEAASTVNGLRAQRDPRVVAVLRDIHDHYDRRRSAWHIARAHGLSYSLLQKLFRASTGRPLHRYTTLVRVSHGVLALACPDRKVGAIAREVGYSSRKDFYRALRDHVGLSPKAIRALPPSLRHDLVTMLAEKLVLPLTSDQPEQRAS
jgi:AraC-like DNA-binding protein